MKPEKEMSKPSLLFPNLKSNQYQYKLNYAFNSNFSLQDKQQNHYCDALFNDTVVRHRKVLESQINNANDVTSVELPYVFVKIGEKRERFLIDTGSLYTIVNPSMIVGTLMNDNLPELVAVNGTNVRLRGKKIVNMEINNELFEQEVLVGDFSMRNILDYNFLYKYRFLLSFLDDGILMIPKLRVLEERREDNSKIKVERHVDFNLSSRFEGDDVENMTTKDARLNVISVITPKTSTVSVGLDPIDFTVENTILSKHKHN